MELCGFASSTYEHVSLLTKSSEQGFSQQPAENGERDTWRGFGVERGNLAPLMSVPNQGALVSFLEPFSVMTKFLYKLKFFNSSKQFLNIINVLYSVKNLYKIFSEQITTL